MKYNYLDAETQQRVVDDLQSAVFHLTSVWDALLDLELILEHEDINDSDIFSLAGACGDPESAFDISEARIKDWVDALDSIPPS